MQDAAHVYADALFEVARDKGKLDAIRDQLAQFADAVDGNRDLQVFFFSPYFSCRQFEELWKRENRRIDVTVTSAVELDPAVVSRIGEEIERQTDQEVDLASRVDADILGGVVLQVGNMVLDASIRNRLEKLRKSVAQAA